MSVLSVYCTAYPKFISLSLLRSRLLLDGYSIKGMMRYQFVAINVPGALQTKECFYRDIAGF